MATFDVIAEDWLDAVKEMAPPGRSHFKVKS
jgi:hypothetical protein